MKQRNRRMLTALGLGGAIYLFVLYWVGTHSTPVEPAGVITLRVAHFQLELGPSDGIAAVIKRYEELNPGIRVQQMQVPGSVYPQWLRANLSGGMAPDIIEYGTWFNGLADVPIRYFAPLTAELLEPNPYNQGTPLAGVPWLKTFSDQLLEQRLNSPEPGQYYSVTLTRSSVRFFCNLDLLYAVTGTREFPTTLTGFRELCLQVKAYAKKNGWRLVPLAGSREQAQWLMGCYLAGTTNNLSRELDTAGYMTLYPRQLLWKYLQGDWSFNRPELRDGMRLMEELGHQMKPGYMQQGRDDAVREFLNGDALCIFAGSWQVTSLRRLAKFPIAVQRCPQPTPDDPVVGRYYMGRFADGNDTTAFGFYLNKFGPHYRASIDFLRFLTSYEGNKLFSDRSGWPPSVRDVPVSPEIASLLSPADGYAYGGAYYSSGGNCRAVFMSNLYLLTGPHGNVDHFIAALQKQMPAAVKADLVIEEQAAWLAVRPQDARIAALDRLMADQSDSASALRERREQLETAQNQSEARALQIAWEGRLSASSQ